MIFLESVRRFGFWLFDLLKGGPVLREYKDVKFLFENANSERSNQMHKDSLHKILKHSVDTTRYYSEYVNFDSLTDFPVINKNIIRDSVHLFLSKSYKIANLKQVTTSGSTGTPFTVFQDKRKQQRHKAENIYFSDILDYRLGTRLYYTRVWNEINKKSLLKGWSQNIIMQDAGNLSDENIEIFIKKLKNDKSNKSILGFASTLEALSRYVSTNKIIFPQGQIHSIISISETLPDGAKKDLKEAFNCPVIARYSNMENGFLAQQCITENNEYHLNQASFHFEILHPELDEPVKPGELGRIIVTDLFNYAMPLIRYDTGDMAILSKKSRCGAQGQVLTKIEGRKVDFIYDNTGSLLSPHVITNTMWKYAGVVRQFQFIQDDRTHYKMKLNCDKNQFNKDSELLADLRHYTGQDSFIEIEFVNDIPMLASGKRKKIVNNYNNT